VIYLSNLNTLLLFLVSTRKMVLVAYEIERIIFDTVSSIIFLLVVLQIYVLYLSPTEQIVRKYLLIVISLAWSFNSPRMADPSGAFGILDVEWRNILHDMATATIMFGFATILYAMFEAQYKQIGKETPSLLPRMLAVMCSTNFILFFIVDVADIVEGNYIYYLVRDFFFIFLLIFCIVFSGFSCWRLWSSLYAYIKSSSHDTVLIRKSLWKMIIFINLSYVVALIVVVVVLLKDIDYINTQQNHIEPSTTEFDPMYNSEAYVQFICDFLFLWYGWVRVPPLNELLLCKKHVNNNSGSHLSPPHSRSGRSGSASERNVHQTSVQGTSHHQMSKLHQTVTNTEQHPP